MRDDHLIGAELAVGEEDAITAPVALDGLDRRLQAHHAAADASRERVDELSHAPAERSKRRSRRPFAGLALLFGARGAEQAPAASALLEPVGERRAQAETVSVAGVDPAEERLEHDVDHLPAETALEEFAHRDVAAGIDGPLHDLAQRAQLAGQGEKRRAQERTDARRDTEHEPIRHRGELAPPKDVDPAVFGDGLDEVRSEAELFAEVKGLGPGHHESIGAGLDHEAIASLGADVAAEARRRFEKREAHGPPFAVRFADHRVRSGEPRKSPADHDYPHRAAGHGAPNLAACDFSRWIRGRSRRAAPRCRRASPAKCRAPG
jgi:hypothetical protein